VTAPAKLAAFAAAVAVAFGLGFSAGAAAGPFDTDQPERTEEVHGEHP
jgi:hypothetical protein